MESLWIDRLALIVSSLSGLVYAPLCSSEVRFRVKTLLCLIQCC